MGQICSCKHPCPKGLRSMSNKDTRLRSVLHQCRDRKNPISLRRHNCPLQKMQTTASSLNNRPSEADVHLQIPIREPGLKYLFHTEKALTWKWLEPVNSEVVGSSRVPVRVCGKAGDEELVRDGQRVEQEAESSPLRRMATLINHLFLRKFL